MREPGLCEILAQTDEETIASLLELVPEDVELVRHPLDGLLLMTCREGLGERFHLGEVLVAECQVLYRTTVGHAMVIGGDGRQALAAAVIDALRTHPDPHPDLSRIEAIVARAREEILAARYLQAQLSASTCVEFDLMPGA